MMKRIIIVLFFLLVTLSSVVFAATQSAEVLAPDLTLNNSDISFSPPSPTAGEHVTITAIIHNVGNATAANITVDFYVDSLELPGEEILELHYHSEKSISIHHLFLPPGSHIITVKIDANNTIKEENEENNNASKTIVVSPPSPPIHPGGGGGGAYPRYFTPAPRDTTPPVISNVSVILGHSAIITWDTNEISDSLVKCGMKSRQYTIEEHNTTHALFHAIHLKELKENNTYYFVVNSTDPSGNAAETPEYIFILTPLLKEKTIIKMVLPYVSHFIISWWIAMVAIIAALIGSFLIYKRYKGVKGNEE